VKARYCMQLDYWHANISKYPPLSFDSVCRATISFINPPEADISRDTWRSSLTTFLIFIALEAYWLVGRVSI